MRQKRVVFDSFSIVRRKAACNTHKMRILVSLLSCKWVFCLAYLGSVCHGVSFVKNNNLEGGTWLTAVCVCVWKYLSMMRMACIQVRNGGRHRRWKRTIVILWKFDATENLIVSWKWGKGSCRQKLVTERAVSMGYLEAWHIQLHSNFPHNPSIHKQLSWGMWIVLLGNSLQKAAHSKQPQVHHQPHINSQTLYTLMWRWGKTDREQYRGLYWLSFSREYHTYLNSLRPGSSHCLMGERLHLLSNYLTNKKEKNVSSWYLELCTNPSTRLSATQ